MIRTVLLIALPLAAFLVLLGIAADCYLPIHHRRKERTDVKEIAGPH